MSPRLQSALPLLVCVLALPLCALLLHPYAEIGVIDDWSYIRTAQILAATGHIVYNGWAAAMLGWQLYFGALLLKLFGFSFTVDRMGTLLIAVCTAALMQRLLVRLGITAWNSAATTLVYILSPVFMAMTFSFMSDIYGICVLVGCFYCCVRAVQASSDRTAAAWLAAAALSDAVGGSARQISWLGLLVMVPCTLFLFRKRRVVLAVGSLATVLGLGIMLGIMHWYAKQPLSFREPVLPPVIPPARLLVFHFLTPFAKRTLCELLFLSTPLLLGFAPSISRNRRSQKVAVVTAVLVILILLNAYRTHTLLGWTFPYIFNGVWYTGFDYFHAYLGSQPVLLTTPVRAAITALLLFSGLALICALSLPPRAPRRRDTVQDYLEQDDTEQDDIEQVPATGLKYLDLLILLVPCTAAYVLLLVTRQITTSILDRYMLFPEFAFLVLAIHAYQHRGSLRLPSAVWVFIAIFAAMGTAGLHDTFALYRAQAALLQELMDAGVPRTAIDGGAQFDGWTQITTVGHMNDKRTVRPPFIFLPLPKVGTDDACRTEDLQFTPVVQAHYVVSFDPQACKGQAPFAPVSFHTWYGPHTRTMYAVLGPYS